MVTQPWFSFVNQGVMRGVVHSANQLAGVILRRRALVVCLQGQACGGWAYQQPDSRMYQGENRGGLHLRACGSARPTRSTFIVPSDRTHRLVGEAVIRAPGVLLCCSNVSAAQVQEFLRCLRGCRLHQQKVHAGLNAPASLLPINGWAAGAAGPSNHDPLRHVALLHGHEGGLSKANTQRCVASQRWLNSLCDTAAVLPRNDPGC